MDQTRTSIYYLVLLITLFFKNSYLKIETFFLKDVRYLKPFIDQVLAEAQEKDDWNSGKIE